MKNEIFNQEALARLRSPEQLDTLFQVTQPVGWMALFTLAFISASIVLWSVYGVISVSVGSVGMIVDSAGIVNVYHEASGKVEEILVYPGSRVRKGDVVARLSQTGIADDIISSRQEIEGAANLQEVRRGISGFRSTTERYTRYVNVVSAYDGIVMEVPVNRGTFVTGGSMVVCSIRQDEDRQDVMAVMYIPVDSGKKVKPGMVANLVPSGTDTKEDGYLLGMVREVSLYPTSSAAIMNQLGNPEIVNWILNRLGGAVMEVRIDLVRDSSSKSGYLWSSVVGTHDPVTVGSVCTGNIVVERRSPLSKAFLKLSQWLRES